MVLLAVVRPDSWNWALYLHIAGAMALVASLILALYAIKIARERGDQPAAEFVFRILWRVTLPAFLVMRIFGQVLASKEKLDDNAPDWLGIGFGASDFGLLFLIILLVLTGLTARKAKQGTSVAGAVQLRAATALAGLLVVAYVIAVWAMTTKPGA